MKDLRNKFTTKNNVLLPTNFLIFINMKKIILLFSLSMILFSCSNNFSVKGKIESMPEQKFVLQELAVNENIIVDSGKTSPTGEFEIKATNKEEKLYCIKFEKGQNVLLALQSGDDANIVGNWNSLEDYTVSGSKSSSTLKGFLNNLKQNITDINTLQFILDSLKGKPEKDSLFKSAETDLRNVNTNFMTYIKKFADTTQSVASALFAVNMINVAYEKPYVTTFYQTIIKRFPKSTFAKLFADRFLGNTKPATSSTEKPNTGSPAADFSGTSPEGKKITLSDFKGNYVLVDFWASWCGPCRKENPNVVEAYNQFKNKKFVIIGVSLDSSKDKCVEAIANDNLTWNHISELKGWGCSIARDYKVESIPQNFLIDPQGNIIAQNLKGENLINKLTEIIK